LPGLLFFLIVFHSSLVSEEEKEKEEKEKEKEREEEREKRKEGKETRI